MSNMFTETKIYGNKFPREAGKEQLIKGQWKQIAQKLCRFPHVAIEQEAQLLPR